ncbi:2-hydroxychromene-2-carboxylate isomerase [Alphaproteobacteria bacterium]|nr:2-hydroxychromene-2-carboxylate isomerase [Alphaproteobacteria bacterium]
MTQTPHFEFLFDVGSPNSYFAHAVLPAIEARTGIKATYSPVLLGGIFKATNNQSPIAAFSEIPTKLNYFMREMERFTEKHAISFQLNPHFPVMTLHVMRGAVFAQATDYFERYLDAIFHHMWVEPKKMDDPNVIASALNQSGLPAAEIIDGSQQPEVKQALIKNTENAVERGVFGAPSFFVGEELFFGKDSMRDVEEQIEKTKR